MKNKIDAKLIGILAGFYTLFNLVYLVKIFYFKEILHEPFYDTSWSNLLVNYVLFDWVVVMVFMTFISISTRKLLQRQVSWPKIFLLHLLFSIGIGVFIRVLGELYEIVFFEKNIQNIELFTTVRQFMAVIDLNFLIYVSMVAIIYIYYYLEKVRISGIKQGELENQLLNTKIRMLLNQLQPHFLFNTLNSISSLIDSDQNKAKDTLADLSDLLRDVVKGKENEVKLEKELEFTNKYIQIIKTRFCDHLIISQRIGKDCMDEIVPSMLLQPLIENSIEHGYSSRHKKLCIRIKIDKKDGTLVIQVINNGKRLQKISPETQGKTLGTGLSNIKERLKQMYGERTSIELANLKNYSGVFTKIIIPLSAESKTTNYQ